MRVGMNYPWFNYGWDFGAPVSGWGDRAAWRSVLASDLETLRSWGVTVVRWFILAEGITYGTGRAAPRRDGEQWRFDRVARIEPAVLEDFRTLLQIFAQAQMRFLPVLIDFKFVFPGIDRQTTETATFQLWQSNRERAQRIPAGYVKGGRFDMLYDSRKRERFFRRVLIPFLEVSQLFSDTIYAWELINEPEWVTRQRGLGGSLADDKRIPLSQMIAFIQEGSEIISDYGFRPTVGFAKPQTLADWEIRSAAQVRALTQRSIATDQIDSLGLGLNQIHYYPREGDELIPANFPNRRRGILGEFATLVRSVSPR